MGDRDEVMDVICRAKNQRPIASDMDDDPRDGFFDWLVVLSRPAGVSTRFAVTVCLPFLSVLVRYLSPSSSVLLIDRIISKGRPRVLG